MTTPEKIEACLEILELSLANLKEITNQMSKIASAVYSGEIMTKNLLKSVNAAYHSENRDLYEYLIGYSEYDDFVEFLDVIDGRYFQMMIEIEKIYSYVHYNRGYGVEKTSDIIDKAFVKIFEILNIQKKDMRPYRNRHRECNK